jgi:hypothetical protein
VIALRVRGVDLSAAEVARFLSHVVVGKRSECWPWRGKLSNNGYARFRVFRNGRVKFLQAHAIALALRIRRAFKLPTHTCDNRGCCNPWHVEPGTASSNLREAWARGRRSAA